APPRPPTSPAPPLAAAVPPHASGFRPAVGAAALRAENCPTQRSPAPALRPDLCGSPSPVPYPPATRSLASAIDPAPGRDRCENPTASGDSRPLRHTASGTTHSPHTAAPTPAPSRSHECWRTTTATTTTTDRSRPARPLLRALG